MQTIIQQLLSREKLYPHWLKAPRRTGRRSLLAMEEEDSAREARGEGGSAFDLAASGGRDEDRAAQDRGTDRYLQIPILECEGQPFSVLCYTEAKICK